MKYLKEEDLKKLPSRKDFIDWFVEFVQDCDSCIFKEFCTKNLMPCQDMIAEFLRHGK